MGIITEKMTHLCLMGHLFFIWKPKNCLVIIKKICKIVIIMIFLIIENVRLVGKRSQQNGLSNIC